MLAKVTFVKQFDSFKPSGKYAATGSLLRQPWRFSPSLMFGGQQDDGPCDLPRGEGMTSRPHAGQ